MSWKQNLYKLNNPKKYIGDPTKLIYKSSWEENAFEMCDNNPNIIKWGYEIVKIPYMKPVENNNIQLSYYFPDLYLEYYDKDKNYNKEIIEIKPLKQTRPSRSKNTLVRMQENYIALVNHAKWEAANNWCMSRGIKFSVLTEKSLFGKKKNK